MRLADDRHHMVLAMGEEGDVAHQHHIVITADFLEGRAKHVLNIQLITGKKLAIGLGDALRRIQKSFAGGIFSCPAQENAHGFFRFGLAWASFGHVWFCASAGEILHDRIHSVSPDAGKGRT